MTYVNLKVCHIIETLRLHDADSNGNAETANKLGRKRRRVVDFRDFKILNFVDKHNVITVIALTSGQFSSEKGFYRLISSHGSF